MENEPKMRPDRGVKAPPFDPLFGDLFRTSIFDRILVVFLAPFGPPLAPVGSLLGPFDSLLAPFAFLLAPICPPLAPQLAHFWFLFRSLALFFTTCGAKFGRKSCVCTFTDKKLLILHEIH